MHGRFVIDKTCGMQRRFLFERAYYSALLRKTSVNSFSEMLLSDKFDIMKRVRQSQGNLFMLDEYVFVTRTSYKIVLKMAERGKPFTDGNFLINSVWWKPHATYVMFGRISLSVSSVVRAV